MGLTRTKCFCTTSSSDAPVYAVGDLADADSAKVDETLRTLTAPGGRVWELLYFHAPGPVQVWLATQAWATDASYHNNIRVTLYGLDRATPVTRTVDANFGPALTLERADVSSISPRPGDLLQVSTHWFVHEQAPEYKFSLRLHNADGEMVQSMDYVPQNWFAPTNVWLVDRPATDQRGVLLPSDMPAGPYRLTLRLYDPATGAAVDTEQGQDVLLAELEIKP